MYIPLLTLAFFSVSSGLTEEPRPNRQIPPETTQDLCNYLKDVEAKTDADCIRADWALLMTQNPTVYAQRLEAVRERKAGVLRAYDFLRLPPTRGKNNAGKEAPPSPADLQPPINERTFLIWVGPQSADRTAVYARWLERRTQELEQAQQRTEDPRRREEIAAALAANRARIAGLQRLETPSQLSCFLGEGCETRRDVTAPADGTTIDAPGAAWTDGDYKRANAEESGRAVRVPGGRIDRGVPDLGMIATEVVENSPVGPLRGDAGNAQDSALGTVATVAFATTGALLLFGGLGGKPLEEKLPNIRRDMGIMAGISGIVAAGAWSFTALAPAPPALTAPAATGANASLTPALAGGGSLVQTGQGIEIVQAAWRTIAIGAGVLGLKLKTGQDAETGGPVVSQAHAITTESETGDQTDVRQVEYERIGDYCNSPPPAGNNECSTLSKQIDHAKKCIELYEKWDARWKPGDHINKIDTWQKRLARLKGEHKRKCAQK